jgi:hypothetical protein
VARVRPAVPKPTNTIPAWSMTGFVAAASAGMATAATKMTTTETGTFTQNAHRHVR